MLRVAHGSTSTLDSEVEGNGVLAGGDGNGPTPLNRGQFRYLFDKLQTKPDSLLPESADTLKHLTDLGGTMFEQQPDSASNSNIPSAYTYFGQFVDHDIAKTVLPKAPDTTDSCELAREDLRPWRANRVIAQAKNDRTAVLELECIYGGDVPKDGAHMSLGRVSPSTAPIKVKDLSHDLVRSGKAKDVPAGDRVALIPDRRNDSNLIVSQMHVAFLRAHNAIVDLEGCSFETAQQLLRQHYHWIVIHDFLKKRIADPDVFKQVMSDPKPRYNPTQDDFYLPLEFTVAAYRFGHSMIRNMYYLNSNYPGEFLLNLFVLCVLSDNTKPKPGAGFDQIPAKRIIGWDFFLTGGNNGLNLNLARKIRTQMADPLRTLLDETDNPVPCEQRLAVQDLRRGYMLRMPTGQAVAKELEYDALTPDEIALNSTAEQREILKSSGFIERTPLWFYILVEAMAQGKGNRLGQVGSRIVAEVLIGLVRKSPDSFLKIPDYLPRYMKNGTFELPDLFKLAGVL